MQTVRRSDRKKRCTTPIRALRIAAAIVGLGLFVAGCGSSSPGSSNSGSVKTFTRAAFQYSSCMREHGLSSFPDPAMTDHDGQQVAYLSASIPVDPSPTYKSAQQSCRGILPTPSNASATQRAQQQETREQRLVAFAKCLRGHGISNFPDPTTQGQLTLEMVSAAGVDLHAPTVLNAAEACIGTTNGTVTRADVERAITGSQ
jgi:hypothetical protein